MTWKDVSIRKWTWQWLALLGLLGLIYYTTVSVTAETLPVTIYPEESVKHSDPNEIPVFYEYQW